MVIHQQEVSVYNGRKKSKKTSRKVAVWLDWLGLSVGYGCVWLVYSWQEPTIHALLDRLRLWPTWLLYH